MGFDVEHGEDITRYCDIYDAIEQTRPSRVYHLAAQTCVPDSFEAPKRSLDINVIGTLNLLEALRNLGFEGPVLIAGTSEEYGYAHSPTARWLTEDSPTRPNTPYGVGKLAASNIGQVYARHHGLNVICTRASNHVGPGQHGGVVAEWACQIVEIERGKRDVLKHGDTGIVRSFMDVRDVVNAYLAALTSGLEPGVYNVSPTTPSVPLNTILIWLTTLADRPIETVEDESLARPTEVKRFVPMSSELFRSRTGWAPRRELKHTLEDVLNWWRKNL